MLYLLAILMLLGVGFGIYAADYYHHGEAAEQILQSDTIKDEGKWLSLESESNEIGLIFYPGGKVEYSAYLPLITLLQEEGINCYLIKMPLNFAFLDVNRAEYVISAHPEIKHWTIAGHSLGGAFASAFAAKHKESIEQLILLGAFIYGDFPTEQTLTIYGSEDRILDISKIKYTQNVHILTGGNHSQFGDYGVQNGDGIALITAEEQCVETVSLSISFLCAS